MGSVAKHRRENQSKESKMNIVQDEAERINAQPVYSDMEYEFLNDICEYAFSRQFKSSGDVLKSYWKEVHGIDV